MKTEPDNQFEAIVGELYEPLFRFAMSLTHSESDALDLTQQTFCVWATKGHQLRDRSKVKTWLFTTMHRAFITMLRREGRFPHHNLEDVTEELPAVSPTGAMQSDLSQVLAALSRVDQVYQAAVALFYLEDYSYGEIARILEVPVGTVKSRIGRGLAQLRHIFLSNDSSVLSPADNFAAPAADVHQVAFRERDFSSTVLWEPKSTFCVTNKSPLCWTASVT